VFSRGIDGTVRPDVQTNREFERFITIVFAKLVREVWTAAIKAAVPEAKAIPAHEVPKRLAAIADRRRIAEEAALLTAAENRPTGDADPAIVLCPVLEDGAA
jgi:hypothetical protein